MDEITPLFKKLFSVATLNEINDDEFKLLEFYVVRLYSKTCNTKEVNGARWNLFSRDNKMIKNVLPTKGVLKQQSSEQSFSLQSSHSLCVKTLIIRMLANGIGRR